MEIVEEIEKKYLVSDVKKCVHWDKEHIVYQWYTDLSESGHSKEKIIFDLLQSRIIYARVAKKTITPGINKKSVEYLDISTFDPSSMVSIPFVLKRRSIKGKLFLDRMIRSNDICEYLLEDENEELHFYQGQEFIVIQEVTNNQEYYNQNMCTSFTEDDARDLSFLLSVF